MAFVYERVFVVLNDKGTIEGIFLKEKNAIESLPDSKRNFPQEIKKYGTWSYGTSNKWRIEQRKIKDSAGIVDA